VLHVRVQDVGCQLVNHAHRSREGANIPPGVQGERTHVDSELTKQVSVERIGGVDQAQHREPEIRVGRASTELNQNLLGASRAETVDKVTGV
jgi:hypothetical protein